MYFEEYINVLYVGGTHVGGTQKMPVPIKFIYLIKRKVWFLIIKLSDEKYKTEIMCSRLFILNETFRILKLENTHKYLQHVS